MHLTQIPWEVVYGIEELEISGEDSFELMVAKLMASTPEDRQYAWEMGDRTCCAVDEADRRLGEMLTH
jgi:hypothetical protein